MPLTLKKHGDIWHFSGTVAGRRIRRSAKTAQKHEAERLANEAESRELQGRRDPASVLTFAQAAMEYRKVRGEPRFLSLVEDHWKEMAVKDITRGSVRLAATTLLPKGSGAYRNRAVITPTLAVINHAAELELCPPMRVKRFPEPKKHKEPATWEWVQAFMVQASPHLGALACFMFLTGARISEALAVMWDDVDLGARLVTITMGKLNGEQRRSNMPPELVAALANIQGTRNGQVFPYASGRAARDPWNVACRRAGIRQLSFHSCRHGFATGLLQQGYDPASVAEQGGWKSPEQLFRTYGHARRDKTINNALIGKPAAKANGEPAQVIAAVAKNG